MVFQWDLVGIIGPRDLNMSKQAHKAAKKSVINVDNIEDTGDRSLPSPVMEITSLVFSLWNTANALFTESASIRETFVWFHKQIVVSLDRMTEVLVKEQAVT